MVPKGRDGGAPALAWCAFELLLPEHLRWLERARDAAAGLIVAARDDGSLRRLLGRGRPLVPLAERLEVLFDLRVVDEVCSCSDGELGELLARASPAALVIGSPSRGHGAAATAAIEAFARGGGRIIVVRIDEHRLVQEVIGRAARVRC